MNTGKVAVSGWMLRPTTWHAWAALGVVLLAAVIRVGLKSSGGGMDNAIVVRAAEAWLEGRSPYADRHFLYLPGAVLAAVPQTLLPQSVVRFLVPAGVASSLVFGWGCALRIYGVRWRSRFAALGLLVLVVVFAPFVHLIKLGNWTVASAAALPLALLLVCRGKWVGAALVIGAAVAVKPLLVPVVLLFVFARRWRALGAAVLVPAVVSVAAALAMPDPAGFFTRTLPFLLQGDDKFVRLYEASPAAILPRLGVPQGAATLLALVAAGAGVWCAWRRWRGGEGTYEQRVVETTAMLMLAAFLVSRPSYDHYLLVVVPMLLAGVLVPGAVAREKWFWLAFVPQIPGFSWPWLEQGTRRAFRDSVTLCVLAFTAARCCLRPPAVIVEDARPPEAVEPAVPVSRSAF
ncbi:glycosyltransferase 87 family protein [Streptomyces sp. Je 1-332]|uniref:glycosyltransferase 87 family protein n=1 Tax=Streptomyces sp. Je 1-332 TaxID=3231270 RepID=UPI00345A314D